MNGQIEVFCYIQLFYEILVYHVSVQVHKHDSQVVSMIHCNKIYSNIIGQNMLVVISYSDIHLVHFSRNRSTKTRISSQNWIEDRTE